MSIPCSADGGVVLRGGKLYGILIYIYIQGLFVDPAPCEVTSIRWHSQAAAWAR